MRRDAVGHTAVNGKIVLGHAARGEPLFKAPPNLVTRQVAKPVDRSDGAVDILDDESGETVLNHFRQPTRD